LQSELLLIPGSQQYIELVDYEGFNHIALYDYTSPTPVSMVTHGEWEVTQIAGFRADTRTAYYLSTEGDETERHLYSVNIDTGISSRVDLTGPGFYAVSFSTQSGFYVLTYNGPYLPYQTLMSTSDPGRHPFPFLKKQDKTIQNITLGTELNITLEDNAALAAKLSTFAMPERMFIKVPAPANGGFASNYSNIFPSPRLPCPRPHTALFSFCVAINCVLILPPDFVESEPRMYSVLHRVYGGPGSNLVQQTFVLDWHTYLASTEEYIISMCDGRGTGQKGNLFKHAVYKNLGEYEAYDNVLASR